VAESTKDPNAAVQAEVDKQKAKEVKDTVRQAEKVDADEFPTERLIEESHAWLGHPSQVLAAGLLLTKNTKKNLTLAEATEACDAFLSHTPEDQEV
jgi:hypothetical protein